MPTLSLARAGRRVAWASWAAAGLIAAAAGAANAGPFIICTTSISSCGCTIVSGGIYTVTAALSSTQGLTGLGGCIDVQASNTTLFTNGFDITGAGTGTGVGIHVLAKNFIFPVSNVFLEAFGPSTSVFTSINGWQYGVESEASNVTVDAFETDHNTTGVLLNGAVNNIVNFVFGISNSQYGVWLKSSFGNQIVGGFKWDSNTIAGVYVGCSATGPTGTICPGGNTSNANFIYDGNADNNSGYGIVVERGSMGNTITDIEGATGNSTFDLFDGNTTPAPCDNNLWRKLNFGTANQSCIMH